MSDQIRWTVSLRKKDVALIQRFEKLDSGDRSAECRRLMYLGMELEAMRANGEEPESPIVPPVRETNVTPIRKERKSDSKELLNKRLDALI